MAIEQINTAAFDYDMMLSFIEGTNIGKSNITISEYDSTAAPVVKVGSKFEVNGALFKVLTADETPSGYAGISNSTTFYIMYDVSGEEFIFTSVSPTWNDALQGWYESGQTDRYFFSMFKDSGGTLYEQKRKFEKQTLKPITLNTKVIKIGDWNMNTNVSASTVHGIADFTKIRSMVAVIRPDDSSSIDNIAHLTAGTGVVAGGISVASGVSISLQRTTGGIFHSASYSSTPFNRGWITIIYEA